MNNVTMPGVYRVTYADWLASPSDGLRREIIDGELFVAPPPNVAHQRISREIEFVILSYLRHHKSGEVFYAPIGMRLSDEHVFEPDLLVVLSGGRAKIEESAIVGPADLVIEILSPGTARRDLGLKRQAYEAFGVREYWIVDPEAQAIEVLTLADNAYVRSGLYRPGDSLTSPMLVDFALALADVFPSR